MSNLLDFDRLSDYITATADRKLVAIASSISSSTGYLRNLVSQSQSFSVQASGYANSAQTAADSADTSATTSLTVFNDFASTYLGVSATEPQVSSQGNPVNTSAFYIRSTDGRFRYVATIDGSGNPVYNDATVTADPASLAAAGAGVFLSVVTTSQQIVRSPVTFQAAILGARVSSWTTQQLVTAIDVNDRIGTVQTAINNEVQRATQAEAGINTNKVSKTGDIMSGPLQVAANGDNASLTIRNNTSGSGRIVRFNVQNDGNFKIYDDTGSIDRLIIRPNGEVFAPSAIVAGTTVTARNMFIDQVDNADAGIVFNRSGAARWLFRRSDSAQRLFISRHNAQGVFIDTPFYINESDGSIVQNRTTINDRLSAKVNITVDGAGASLTLNNTSGSADPTLKLQHNGVGRWSVGRSQSNGIFYINRENSSGVYVDTPLSISESTGNINVKGLTSTTTLVAGASVSAPIIYATANGDGRAIAVGDDAWIGDVNIANTLSIRGQANNNAGYISFGNSQTQLGCNANDATLRFGGNVVWHSGNFNTGTLGYDYGTTGGVDWSTRPAGNGKRYITYSGSTYFTTESTVVTINLPFAMEKIMAYSAVSYYNTLSIGNYHDTFSGFAQPPSGTQVKVFVNKTSGDSVLPVWNRWTVEGILA